MNVVKNSFGVSYALHPKIMGLDKLGTFGGSSLNRKKAKPLTSKKNRKERAEEATEERKKRENRLSPRSRMKIRAKIHAFTGVVPHLVFVTLTFQNKVEDRQGMKVLKTFLNNVRKRKPEFEYLFVAEKQGRNKKFKGNLHFHLVTNVYWDIKRWWQYWVEVQEKHGILREEGIGMASSAFDVKKIKSSETRKIGGYIAGYLSKSEDTFDCRVWHCSKRISRLYTAFYSGPGFLENLRRLEEQDLLGGKVTTISKEFCSILFYPLNRVTTRFYDKLHEENRKLWQQGKEVASAN
jgi:hypothetical protein